MERLRHFGPSAASEPNLTRYSSSACDVLAVLLGLVETATELSAEARHRLASDLAGVPMATLKTRDSNLLLDAFARHLDRSTRQGALGDLRAIEPRRIRQDLSYTAGIEYRKVSGLGCYQVSSSFRSQRVMPVSDVVEVVFCRTASAMEAEYLRPATIAVELCDFDPTAWNDVVENEIGSTLQVASQECRLLEPIRSSDTIRLRFAVSDIDPKSPVAVRIRNTYVIPGWSRVYPIKLGRYFLLGPVEMSVTLIDPRAAGLDVFTYLSLDEHPHAEADETVPAVEVERFLTPTGTRQHTVRLRTPPGLLVWPNGGADFVWHRR